MEETTFYLLVGLIPSIFAALSFFVGKLLYTYFYFKEGKDDIYLLGGIFTTFLIFVPFGFGLFAEGFGEYNFQSNSAEILKIIFIGIGLAIIGVVAKKSSPILERKREPIYIIKKEGFATFDEKDSLIKLFVYITGGYLALDMFFSGISLSVGDYSFVIQTVVIGFMFLMMFSALASAYWAYYPSVIVHLKSGEVIWGYLLKIQDASIEILGITDYSNKEILGFLRKYASYKEKTVLIPARYIITTDNIKFFMIPEKTSTIRRAEQLIKYLKDSGLPVNLTQGKEEGKNA